MRASEAQRHELENRAAAAVASERSRIARELHDIVSHSISVIAIQAQAVRRRLSADQEREAADLRNVETTARQAMSEMRRLFGVLKVDGQSPALSPQPGLAQIEELVEHTRSAGSPVALGIEGEQVALPPGVDLAAYRIVQESLTNVRRHAEGAAASVLLVFRDSRLEIVVENDGDGRSSGQGGPGHGLIWMRERVTLYNGSFDARARRDGGFRVSAVLPLPRDGIPASLRAQGELR